MIEIIGGTWAAGETKTFHVNGEYLEILDCQYTCDVMLMDKVGAQLSIMKGCEASFFSRPREGYNTIQIYSPQAQYLRVFLGSGDAGTRRISSTVSVIDGGRARTNAGVAFIAGDGAAASATDIATVQLWNPVASGKRLIVARAMVGCDNVATAIAYGYRALAFGTAGAPIQSKLVGQGAGSSSALQYRPLGVVTAPPSSVTQIAAVTVPAGGTVAIEWREPLVVPPGQSLVFYTAALNAILRTSVEFFEEVI